MLTPQSNIQLFQCNANKQHPVVARPKYCIYQTKFRKGILPNITTVSQINHCYKP